MDPIKYNGSNLEAMLIWFMERVQVGYPEIFTLLVQQKLPIWHPQNPDCSLKARDAPKIQKNSNFTDYYCVPVSPNEGMIMTESKTFANVSEESSSVSNDESSDADSPPESQSSKAPGVGKKSRESLGGMNPLFGNMGGMFASEPESRSVAKCAAYFPGDPFEHERCTILLDDERKCSEYEQAFGGQMQSVCGQVLMCLVQVTKNKANTIPDFRKAQIVGRVDIMIFILRNMDVSNLSAILRKNMLNTQSFPVLVKFFAISQSGDSMDDYIKKFNNGVVALATLGAMVGTDKSSITLIENIWGQLFLYGLNSSYKRLIINAVEKGQLEFPDSTIDKVQGTAKGWEVMNLRRNNFQSSSTSSTANATFTDMEEDEPDVKAKGGKKHGYAKHNQKDVNDAVEKARAECNKKQQVAIQAKVAEIHKQYEKKLQATSPYCFLCGYNKGHESYKCSRLPTNLVSDAKTEFDRQHAFLSRRKKK